MGRKTARRERRRGRGQILTNCHCSQTDDQLARFQRTFGSALVVPRHSHRFEVTAAQGLAHRRTFKHVLPHCDHSHVSGRRSQHSTPNRLLAETRRPASGLRGQVSVEHDLGLSSEEPQARYKSTRPHREAATVVSWLCGPAYLAKSLSLG